MTHAALTLFDPAAPAEGFRVVHSSYGRLRVHLPDAGEQTAARLRKLPGVTSAEANEWTGNLLIQFDPRQTSAAALCVELHALCLGSPGAAPDPLLAVVTAVAAAPHASTALVPQREAALEQPARYVTGTRGQVYKVLGWSSVGMAGVGAVLPGIPTVPFVVLASYFFVRSSPEAHDWLLRSRWFGQVLRDWEERGGVRRSVKVMALGLMGASAVATLLIGLPTALVASILALEAVGAAIVLRLPEVESAAVTPAPV